MTQYAPLDERPAMENGSPDIGWNQKNPGTPSLDEISGQAIPERLAELSRRELVERLAETEKKARMFESRYRESNHRIKNHLQAVSSFLILRSMRGARSRDSGILTEAVAKVSSVSRLHELLATTHRGADMMAADYLNGLLAGLKTLYENQGSIKADIQNDWAMPPEKLLIFGMIVSELVSNAMKYGHDPDQPAKVMVCFGQNTGRIRLEVSDQGPGLPCDHGSPANPDGSKREDRKMDIVQSLAKQLGGTLEMDSSRGLRVIIDAPGVQPDY